MEQLKEPPLAMERIEIGKIGYNLSIYMYGTGFYISQPIGHYLPTRARIHDATPFL